MDRMRQILSYLEKTPGDSFLQHALALEYVKQGNDPEAIRVFRELLHRDPAYVGSYYHLGAALERTGDPAAALSVYREGIAEARRQGETRAASELGQAAEALED